MSAIIHVADEATSTAQISDAVLKRSIDRQWMIGLMVGFTLLMVFLYAITYLLLKGVGIWGLQIPVAWGFAIVNFVWWVGIGHAGTFISAILFLLKQEWRTSINRFAEAMTLFAVACAGLFPLLHMGRPWFFYWMLPYPNTMALWPQFRSPLVWDVFAVLTYLIVSALFWYVGLIPDLAILRDRETRRPLKYLWAILAVGWRGSGRHWTNYAKAYLMLAGLATPLVISVHSIVALDFTAAIVNGWHSTIFPIYFVAGAIFSGFAMVLTIAIPLRKYFKFENLITTDHLEMCAKLLLLTGVFVSYSYLIEYFFSWYSDDPLEWQTTVDRFTGAYAIPYAVLLFCNLVVPQFLWVTQIRRSAVWLFVISLFVNLGMWLERFIIVVQSLHHDFLPSDWRVYKPSPWDWATLLGSFGLFLFLFYLFIRILPVISISEIAQLVHKYKTRSASTQGIRNE